MSKLIAIMTSTVGGAIGWWAGSWVGFMTAYMVSVVGTSVGWYVGRRLATNIE